MPANASAKNPPEERLVNLVVALVATDQGLTKDTILSSVAGYREQSEARSVQGRAREDVRARQGEPPPPRRADRDHRRLGRPRRPARGALPRPDGGVRAARRHRVHPRRARAAQSRGRRLERELDVGRRAQRAAQDPRARHPGRRADHRLLAAHQPARPVVRRAAAGDRAVAGGDASPTSSPARTRPRTRRVAAARARRVRGRAGTSSASISTSPRTARSCCCASSDRRRPSPARPSTPRCARARASGRWRVSRTSPRRNSALLEVNPGTEAALRLSRRALPADQGIRVPFVDVHVFADELASYGPEVRVRRARRAARPGHRAARSAPATAARREPHDRPQARSSRPTAPR